MSAEELQGAEPVKTSLGEDALRLRKSGMTFIAIGRQMGFSIERARQLVKRAEHADARKSDPLSKLSVRTQSALKNGGIVNIEQLKIAGPSVMKSWAKDMPNFGKTSLKEVFNLMGWEANQPKKCPHCGGLL